MRPSPLHYAAFALLAAAASTALAQTAFTYQAQLNEDSLPADGDYDFIFRLYDAPNGGNEVAPAAGIDDWPVSGGQFMVQLDFGGAAFDGDPRWIRVEVRPGASVGPYTVLDPRQPVTPAPYALYAFGGPGGGGGFWTASGSHIHNANTGNVGIGTDTPAVPLHVEGNTQRALIADNTGAAANASGGWFQIASTTGQAVLGQATASTGVNYGGRFYSNSSSGAGVFGLAFANSGTTYGVYGRSASSGGDSAGVFGESNGGPALYAFKDIGTSGPGLRVRKMGVVGHETVEVEGTSINSFGNAAVLSLNDVSPDDIALAVGGGSVGIGTASPLAPLHVNGRLGEQTVRFSGADGNYRFLQTLDSSDLASWTFRNGLSTPALRITSSGDVGVGLNSPSAKLHAQAGTGDAVRGVSTGGAGLIGNSGSGYGVFGSSKAGYFLIANTANGDNAVEGHTYGTGVAVHGHTEGDGWAGYFVNRSATNAKTALYCRTDGTGLAFHAEGTARVEVLEITGADVAEKFPTSERGAIEPGTVMAIDPANPGKLCIAAGAYNRCVAGVVSGAGDLPVGAVLGNLKGHHPDAPPIALSGRVWVRCDASERTIRPGDMLTTADTAGHAMGVADYTRAHGAVIGKAMTALDQGETGLVLVLVNLQ
jgi:hypothetical protein